MHCKASNKAIKNGGAVTIYSGSLFFGHRDLQCYWKHDWFCLSFPNAPGYEALTVQPKASRLHTRSETCAESFEHDKHTSFVEKDNTMHDEAGLLW